mmetsp:Transcript_12860/g.27138  ORF Transcript_12860/g.27138 Transcript_12860/m.27138 type:complete len:227 (+) Transcript_12860:1069-1749(+)
MVSYAHNSIALPGATRQQFKPFPRKSPLTPSACTVFLSTSMIPVPASFWSMSLSFATSKGATAVRDTTPANAPLASLFRVRRAFSLNCDWGAFFTTRRGALSTRAEGWLVEGCSAKSWRAALSASRRGRGWLLERGERGRLVSTRLLRERAKGTGRVERWPWFNRACASLTRWTAFLLFSKKGVGASYISPPGCSSFGLLFGKILGAGCVVKRLTCFSFLFAEVLC